MQRREAYVYILIRKRSSVTDPIRPIAAMKRTYVGNDAEYGAGKGANATPMFPKPTTTPHIEEAQ